MTNGARENTTGELPLIDFTTEFLYSARMKKNEIARLALGWLESFKKNIGSGSVEIDTKKVPKGLSQSEHMQYVSIALFLLRAVYVVHMYLWASHSDFADGDDGWKVSKYKGVECKVKFESTLVLESIFHDIQKMPVKLSNAEDIKKTGEEADKLNTDLNKAFEVSVTVFDQDLTADDKVVVFLGMARLLSETTKKRPSLVTRAQKSIARIFGRDSRKLRETEAS